MFANCINLVSINLISFITSNTENMKGMFSNCINLESLDLSSFDTSKVQNMSEMFYGCNSITTLNLSNFDTKKVVDMEKMFTNCSSLVYLNISNFTTTEITNTNANMFYNIDNNRFNYCLYDDNQASYIYNTLKTMDNAIRDCSDNCYPVKRNYLVEMKKCSLNCSLYIDTPYEYNNICYDKCPKRTNVVNFNYLCEDLNCVNYYNYNQSECIDIIPEGYYCNDTFLKTIDECHPECRECKSKDTENNMNCISCPNETFLFLGNCVSSCQDGYFRDENDISKKICKCPDTKCFHCSIEAYDLHLCDSCNDDYYPIFNEEKTLNYFNCYKDPDQYYLDKNEYFYKNCYHTCKKCKIPGNLKNNNCDECLSGFIFKDNFENDNNCYENCTYNYYFDENRDYYCTSNEECPQNEYNKLIPLKKKCIDDCKKDEIYKYEFRKTCYNECPQKPYETKNNSFYCEILCPLNQPYEIRETQTCVDRCNNAYERFVYSCILYNVNADITKQDQDELLKSIRELKDKGELKEIISNVIKKGEIAKIFNKNVNFTITSTEIQKKDGYILNETIISLGECEKILRSKNSIPEKMPLIIFKVDIIEERIKKYEYDIWDPITYKTLDLSICDDKNIDLTLSADIKEEDIDKHNTSSAFYNDICYIYVSDEEIYVPFQDRMDEFFEKNYAICEENCEFTRYDLENNYAVCSCPIIKRSQTISEISINKTKFFENANITNIANMKVMKCFYIFFSKEGIKSNIGSYIILFIIILNAIFCFFFIKKIMAECVI